MKANMQTLSEFPKSSIAQTLRAVGNDPQLIGKVINELQATFALHQQRIQERKAQLESLLSL